MIRTLILLLFIVAPLWGQATWVDGQAARLVFGQPSFTRQAPVSSRETIGGIQGVAVAANRLFVADGNKLGSFPVNNRVLIYEDLPGDLPDLDAELPQDSLCPVCVGLPDVVLGQEDFDSFDPGLSAGLQNPTALHSDGVMLAVADTDNNRVLLWRTLPATNATPPDVVVGQPDFESNLPRTAADGLRGPQGVWIDGGRLFIADTLNGRVLIYNSIPISNGASANVVLGQPDFETRPEPDLTQSNVQPTASGMLDPLSVTVSSGRVFVSDLGFNRVMIFFTVPTQNNFPADAVIGQPDFESNTFNNSEALCEPLPEDETDDDSDDGTDDGPQFPRRCDRTLSFPRFALSDGTRLYVADGGNDRILIFNEVPMENGARADRVLGQPDFETLIESDGAASLRAPSSLAYDGLNLYVADPFSRRVLVFTPADDMIARDGLVNGASFAVRAHGTATWGGQLEAGQENTLTVNDREYKHTAQEGDTSLELRNAILAQILDDPDSPVTAEPIFGAGDYAQGRVKFGGEIQAGDVATLRIADQTYGVTVRENDTVTGMVDLFNFFIQRRPDPNIASERDPADTDTLLLTARQVGRPGNEITYSVSLSPGARLTAEAEGGNLSGGETPFGIRLVAKEAGLVGNFVNIDTSTTGDTVTAGARSGPRLTGGSDARELPAGTIASVFGENFAEATFEAELVEGRLPTELGGVRVYVNGMLAPLYSVAPQQINFQVPYETAGASISVYVWRRTEASEVMVSAPRAARVARASPGLFAFPGPEPRRGIVAHAAGPAQGTVGISTVAGNENIVVGTVATIEVNGRLYEYVTQDGDSPASIRDNLVTLINAGDGDPEVTAAAGEEGFFSARADITLSGEIQAGDRVTIFVSDRVYFVVVEEDDTLVSVRNKLVFEINAGRGDPEVTARRIEGFGDPVMQVVARALGVVGNDIPFSVSVNDGAMIQATTNAEDGFLLGGQTPPVVTLTAREPGRQGNEIEFAGRSTNTATLTVTARANTLCCGNEPFSLVTDENPAVPGETIVVFGSGLGLTAPLPQAENLKSGEPTPLPEPFFTVPAVSDDFVSSIAGGRTAVVQFVGLMPGLVGVYQINLRLNNDLPDDPDTIVDIRQVVFFSNIITIPVKNLRPRTDLN